MLGPAGEDVNDPFHLALAPHQGTKSVAAGFSYQIAKRAGCGRGFGTLRQQDLGRPLDRLLPQPVGTESIVAQDRRGRSGLLARDPQQQVFRADVALLQAWASSATYFSALLPEALKGISPEVEVFVLLSKALRTRA